MTTNKPSPPLHFLVPIYPGFQLLDLAGPLDILNDLTTQPSAPAITLTFISDTLDPVHVKPIPPPSASWTFALTTDNYQDPSNINFNFSQTFTPKTTYSTFLADPQQVDVLLIPGGHGSRLERIQADGTHTSNVQELMEFIPKIAPQIRHSIITVCTGSYILSNTGLLNSRRATTNMTRFDKVAASNPKVKWQTAARWVKSVPSELDHDEVAAQPASNIEIWTSAGISAGMDVTLAFIAEYYGGIEMARRIARMLEYDWREIGEGERDPLYGNVDVE